METILGRIDQIENESIDERCNKIKEVIQKAMITKEVKSRRRKALGHKDWWDRSYTKRKRALKKIYQKWKKGKSNLESLITERKDFRQWLKQKRRKI